MKTEDIHFRKANLYTKVNYNHFDAAISHFYTPVKDGMYYVITRGGRAASPILCPKHSCKTTLVTVLKFHGWIDLIKAECSAEEP